MEDRFDNNIPIYVQLVEHIKVNIVSGKILPGDKLLSVRELALKYKVNPNTMQKALVELGDEKLIYTESTNGKYVTKDHKLIENIKKELAKDKVFTYIDSMEKLGISIDESIKYLKERI